MTNKYITLQIRGRDDDNGDLHLDDFIKQLDVWKTALNETDRIVSEGSTVYYKIVDLSRHSPAMVVLEAVPIDIKKDTSYAVIGKFFKSISEIEHGIAPSGFDYKAFQSYKDMAGLLGKKVSGISFAHNGETVSVSSDWANKVTEILGPDEYEVGSVTGMLDYINIHAGQNCFIVYPTTRRPKVRCIFPTELRDDAIRAIAHYVSVYGRMKFKTRTRYSSPYEILVNNINTYPPESELPKLSDLRGKAPDATGDISTEEFVRRLRNDWES